MLYRTNPASGEAMESVEEHSDKEVGARMERAEKAFFAWRKIEMEERAGLMKKMAGVLRGRKQELAKLMALEMGKPVTAGEQEVEKCAAACEFFAENAAGMLANEMIATDAAKSYVRFDPLGPVLAIMPWNFPLWQVFRFAAPALMAGNVGVLKHAPNVPGCAMAIEGMFLEAGFPEGVFQSVLVGNERAAGLIRYPAIKAVTLTGSERAGMAVAAEAGKVLKKTVLELGGSDAFIVLKDVDVAKVAREAAAARCINAGQSCIAAKRFIVAKEIAQEFEAAFAKAMREMVVGDPLDAKTQVGPLARLDLRENLEGQVERAVGAGAKVLCGGKRLERAGYFYEPTVLANVGVKNAVWEEETFGPVAAIMEFAVVAEAVQLANSSRYGLGASVWTRDLEVAEKMAGELEAGCVFVNEAVKSDVRMPFGGVRNSGYGRELSEVGMKEFVNVKSVWVRGDVKS